MESKELPSDTVIYGISRDGSKIFDRRTCEHMIPGQLMMGARQAKNAPLLDEIILFAVQLQVIDQRNFND